MRIVKDVENSQDVDSQKSGNVRLIQCDCEAARLGLCVTFSSVLSDDCEGGRFVDHAVTQTRAVCIHVPTVNGIYIELQWTSCRKTLKEYHFMFPDDHVKCRHYLTDQMIT